MKKRYVMVGVVLLAACFLTAPVAFSYDDQPEKNCQPSRVAPKGCLQRDDFKPIGTGGFGDTANSYSWGVAYHRNALYVGTVRHHLWSLMTGLGAMLPIDPMELEDLMPAPPENTEWGNPKYAEAMRGEIWRYKCGKWERVHQSSVWELPQPIEIQVGGQTLIIPAGTYPTTYGYRVLGRFKGWIYACGVGTWIPPLPFTSILRSKTGDRGTWEDVTRNLGRGLDKYNSTNVRGLISWKNKLYVSASISPDPGDPYNQQSVVWCNADPGKEDWKMVSLPGFGGNNAEIYYLQVFNNHLYASTVNYVSGFEVWKTDGSPDDGNNGLYEWKPVIVDGFGDTWNQYGMHMEVFKNHLYVGTAVGAGMVQKNGEMVGTRPIEIIRLDKNDNAKLIVGSRVAFDPVPGWPKVRKPLSGWSAGFGNPFNVYAWIMEVHKGRLYVGTFDMSSIIIKVLAEHPEVLLYMLGIENEVFQSNDEMKALLYMLYDYFGGGDLWCTKNGIKWAPVTLNGFDNPKNYGIRRLLSVSGKNKKKALFVGTANPFTGQPGGGCEVWQAGCLK